MSTEVWRYEVHPLTTQQFSMPKGAKPLHVAEHPAGDISMWALVDTHAEREMREFTVAGTGWQIVAEDARYIGTAPMREGLVFHVFETTMNENGSRDAQEG